MNHLAIPVYNEERRLERVYRFAAGPSCRKRQRPSAIITHQPIAVTGGPDLGLRTRAMQ
jgi:hypothetical protein